RDLVDRRADCLVPDRNGEAATFTHGAQDEKVSDRLRHADARRDGVRVLPARRVLLAGFEGAHDGSAARRLYRDHARALFPEKADRLELRERLPHADQAGAAAGRIKHDVRQLPAELLGELEAHGLLALDPVRLLQGRGIEPSDLRLPLRDDTAAIVDQAVDSIDASARE